MKAYLVNYDLGGSSGNQVVVLVKEDQTLYEAMEAKTAFRKSDTYSIIRRKQEVPLSRVKLSELSVTEFFMIQGAELGS